MATDEERDALRRRLYRQGASPDDVARYRDLVPAPAVAPDEQPPPRSRPRRGPIVAGAAIAGTALAAGLLLQPATVTAPPTHSPRPVTTPTDVVTLLSIPVPARNAFVRSLRAGAGLSAYFLRHNEDVPAAIRTVTRADTQEYAGVGTHTVVLNPSALAARGGRVTVVVVTDADTAERWQVDRPPVGAERSRPLPGSTRALPANAGVPVTATTAYVSPAPTSLIVSVAEGVAWGATVTFTN